MQIGCEPLRNSKLESSLNRTFNSHASIWQLIEKLKSFLRR